MAAEAKLDKVLREIADHLSFLGYEGETREGKFHPYLFIQHQTSITMLLDVQSGVILLRAFFGGNESVRTERNALLGLLNDLNSETAALKIFVDPEGDFTLETYMQHEYSKASFAAFWALIENDIKIFRDGRIGPFVA